MRSPFFANALFGFAAFFWDWKGRLEMLKFHKCMADCRLASWSRGRWRLRIYYWRWCKSSLRRDKALRLFLLWFLGRVMDLSFLSGGVLASLKFSLPFLSSFSLFLLRSFIGNFLILIQLLMMCFSFYCFLYFLHKIIHKFYLIIYKNVTFPFKTFFNFLVYRLSF